MARDFTGVQYGAVANGIISGPPFSMGCWFNKDSAANNGRLMHVGQSGAFDDSFFLNAQGGAGGDPVRFIARTTGNFTVSTTTGFTAGVWHHALAVATATNDRDVYIDGGSSANTTVDKVITAPDTFRMARGLANGEQYTGLLAEMAFWNVALTAAEAAMLGLGVSPLFVRPSALVAYWPLIGRYSPEIDRVGGFGLTLTGAPSSAVHPRVLSPSQQIWTPFPAAAAGNIITANQDEAGDTQVASIQAIAIITANQTEDGDVQVASLLNISAITANQDEVGDTQVASLLNISSITADQDEDGDTQVALILTLVTSSITADQDEDGDTQIALLNAIASIIANQLEVGDTQAADLSNVVSITANQLEAGDIQVAKVLTRISPDCVFQVTAVIDATGQRVRAKIEPTGQRSKAVIEDLLQVNATIDGSTTQVRAKIDSNGQRIRGNLCR